MAKDSYKIPANLADGYTSMDISLSTRDGSVTRMVSLKNVLIWGGSLVLYMYCLMKTFVSAGTLPQKILFTVLWILFTIVLGKPTKTGRLQGSLALTLFSYLPKKNRNVITRGNAQAIPFGSILSIESIDENGIITWYDKTVGVVYQVVGSASILLFESDRDAILNRVDSFYRKIGTDVEISFVTSKESQKVYYQLAHLKRLYDKLEARDEDLLNLMEERFSILKDDVGDSFKSIHQYCVLKADNKEALQQAINVFQSEVENSSLMVKRCLRLKKPEDVQNFLKPLYTSDMPRGNLKTIK